MTEPLTCAWLVEVPSGNPEPDSYADTVMVIECGVPLTVNEYGSYRCEAGHEHVSYADPEYPAWELEQAYRERLEG